MHRTSFIRQTSVFGVSCIASGIGIWRTVISVNSVREIEIRDPTSKLFVGAPVVVFEQYVA